MISAFETYLLFQLDSVVTTLAILSMIGGGVMLFMTLFCILELDEEKNQEFAKTSKRSWQALAAMITLATFVPDSKTVAAMIVLPAITDDKVIETVTPEAREVYDLAKKALRQLSQEHDDTAAGETK